MHRKLPLLLAFVAVFAGVARGQADTPAALRQRITELERQVETLKAELASLRAEHRATLIENRSLRRSLADAKAPAATDATGNAPPASGQPAGGQTDASSVTRDPLASPDDLYVALVLDYHEQIGEIDVSDANGLATLSRRALAWTKSAHERLSGQSEWLTRLVKLEETGDRDSRPAWITILDPATLAPIGGALEVDIPIKFVPRIENEIHPPDGSPPKQLLWKLSVQVSADPVHQPDRSRPGPFNYPKFIGPFAGFGYSVKVQAMGPVTPEDAKKAYIESKPGEPPVDR